MAMVHNKDIIIIHGGLILSDVSQELVALSTQDDRVSSIREVAGKSPGMLESHSCVKVNDSYIFYGGISSLN